jgi:hypothetical protein
MALDRGGIGGVQIAVIEAGGADIDADFGARERAGRDAGVFERAPDDIEQEALLRVDFGGFARLNAEDRRVEPQRIVDIAAREGVAEAGLALVRMEEPLGAPPAGGQRPDRAAFIDQ